MSRIKSKTFECRQFQIFPAFKYLLSFLCDSRPHLIWLASHPKINGGRAIIRRYGVQVGTNINLVNILKHGFIPGWILAVTNAVKIQVGTNINLVNFLKHGLIQGWMLAASNAVRISAN